MMADGHGPEQKRSIEEWACHEQLPEGCFNSKNSKSQRNQDDHTCECKSATSTNLFTGAALSLVSDLHTKRILQRIFDGVAASNTASGKALGVSDVLKLCETILGLQQTDVRDALLSIPKLTNGRNRLNFFVFVEFLWQLCNTTSQSRNKTTPFTNQAKKELNGSYTVTEPGPFLSMLATIQNYLNDNSSVTNDDVETKSETGTERSLDIATLSANQNSEDFPTVSDTVTLKAKQNIGDFSTVTDTKVTAPEPVDGLQGKPLRQSRNEFHTVATEPNRHDLSLLKTPFATFEQGKLRYPHLKYPPPVPTRNQRCDQSSRNCEFDDMLLELETTVRELNTMNEAEDSSHQLVQRLQDVTERIINYKSLENFDSQQRVTNWVSCLQHCLVPAILPLVLHGDSLRLTAIVSSLVKQCRAFHMKTKVLPENVYIIDMVGDRSNTYISLRAAWDDSEKCKLVPCLIDAILATGMDGLWYIKHCFQDGVNATDRAVMTYLSRFPEVRSFVVAKMVANEISESTSRLRRETGVLAAALLGESLGSVVLDALSNALERGSVDRQFLCWSLASLGSGGLNVLIQALSISDHGGNPADVRAAACWGVGLASNEIASGLFPKAATHVTASWDYATQSSRDSYYDQRVIGSKQSACDIELNFETTESSTAVPNAVHIIAESGDNNKVHNIDAVDAILEHLAQTCQCTWPSGSNVVLHDKECESHTERYCRVEKSIQLKRITVCLNAQHFVAFFTEFQEQFVIEPVAEKVSHVNPQIRSTMNLTSATNTLDEDPNLYSSIVKSKQSLLLKLQPTKLDDRTNLQREAKLRSDTVMDLLVRHKRLEKQFFQVTNLSHTTPSVSSTSIVAVNGDDPYLRHSPADTLRRLTTILAELERSGIPDNNTLSAACRTAARCTEWVALELCKLTPKSRGPLVSVVLNLGLNACERTLSHSIAPKSDSVRTRHTVLSATASTATPVHQFEQHGYPHVTSICAMLLGSLGFLHSLLPDSKSHRRAGKLFELLLAQENYSVQFSAILGLSRWGCKVGNPVHQLILQRWKSPRSRVSIATCAAMCLLHTGNLNVLIDTTEHLVRGTQQHSRNLVAETAAVITASTLDHDQLSSLPTCQLRKLLLVLVVLSQSSSRVVVTSSAAHGQLRARALWTLMRLSETAREQIQFLRMRSILPLCVLALKDSSKLVRSCAAHELAKQGPEGELLLVGRALDGTQEAERCAAIDGLQCVGPSRCAETVALSLQDSSAKVRAAAKCVLVSWSKRRWELDIDKQKRLVIGTLLESYLEVRVAQDKFEDTEFGSLTELASRLMC